VGDYDRAKEMLEKALALRVDDGIIWLIKVSCTPLQAEGKRLVS